MMEMQIITPPRTVLEVFKIVPEGTLCEVINNQFLMLPLPVVQHQRIVSILSMKIHNWLELYNWGEVLFAPLDVYLDEIANAVQPDIFVLKNGGDALVEEKGFVHGSPAVIIEILSEGNKDHDKIIKKNLYEKFGVQEYFIVEPETKEVIHYLLTGGMYLQLETTTAVLHSRLLNARFEF